MRAAHARRGTARDGLPRNRATAAFERRARRVLDAHVAPDAMLVVAVSGGPDSTAVLAAVARSRAAATVVAACFDHRMRPASETAGDRAFVDEVATALGVAVHHGAAEVAGARSEAQARELRYRWLRATCAATGARAAVTGHTLDDQAETVLLRLTRGTGLAGAGGMAECAPWPVAAPVREGRHDPASPAPRIVRPLLEVTRAQVLEYLDALELTTREDATNEVLTFDRNRVRHRVLAELRRINPRASERIGHFARLAREDDAALLRWAERACAELASWAPGEARLERRGLRTLPSAVASRVLRLAGDRIGLALDAAQVDALRRAAGRRGARVSLAGGDAATDERSLVLRSAAATPET